MELAPLFEPDGPFVTLYLDARSDVENAASRLELRWKNARRELEGAGADGPTLEAIDAVVAADRPSPGGDTLAIVATGGRVLHARHYPDPPQRDLIRWAPLPSVAPLLEWRQSLLPHLVVLTDRTGADLVAVVDGATVRTEEVQGDDHPVHRTGAGGWSQRRYQQRVENTWEANAGEVAEEVTRLADRIGPRLVVVAGDVRAVQLLQEELPERVLAITDVLDHGGTLDQISEGVVKLVASAAAEDTVAVLREFREERGQHDRAAEGVDATLAALARAQVATLLVHDDPDDERTAWFGPEANQVGTDPVALADMGVKQPRQGRLVDVAIRAALGTNAEVRVVPSTTAAEGLGAILRYSLS